MADAPNWDDLRDKIIGFGENSARKSYYPELQNRLADLQRFSALLDKSADGIIQANAESGYIIELNEAAANMLSLTKDKLIGKSIYPFFPQNVTDIIKNTFFYNLEPIQAVISIRTSLISETRGVFDVELSIQQVVLNNKKYFVIIARDITEHKRAEDQLKANASWLSILFERSPMGIVVTGENRTIIETNPAFCEMSGYAKEELIGQAAHIIHVSLKSSYEFAIKYAQIVQGERINFEYQMRRKNGELYWVEAVGQAFDPNDLAKGTIWQVIEITEKKNAELALVESEEKFRTITEQMADVVFILDKDGICKYLSPAAWHFFNINPKQILNRTLVEFILPEEAERVINAVKSVVNDNKPLHDFHVTLIRDDGQKLFGEISATKYIGQNFNGMLGVMRDVTERKKTELHVQKLTKGIEQSSAIIIITDAKGIIEYVNPRFESVTGYSFAESIGRNPRFLQSGKTKPEVYQDLWNTIKGGKEWKGELLNRKKNGEYFWENLSISPILNENFEIINYVGIKEDITEKRNMIRELIEAKENAEEMNRLKSSFLANMSHELRTPMLGILGYSGIMKEIADDDELKRMAETIHLSGTRLTETLNLILDISRIEAGKLELNIGNMNMPKLIQECITLHEKSAQKKDLYIKFKSFSYNFETKGDERIFRDIINNLLNNAVKFTFKGGVTITLSLCEMDNSILLSIADTGIGIPVEQQEVIFEEFRQVSEGLDRAFEGSGLGLTVTKNFVEKLGGNISVISSPGSGTAFNITLPFVPAENEIPVTNLIEAPDDAGKLIPANDVPFTKEKTTKSLLLVENDETNQMVISHYLKDEYIVDIVEKGEAAIKAAEEKYYNIILMDINLGRGLSGIDVTEKLRALKQYSSTPIIAITAFAMKGDKEEFLNKGCSGYLSKPFNKKELLDLINELTDSENQNN